MSDTTQPLPRPVTRALGEAERTLRALLESHLASAGLSFPEWTTFVTINIAGPLTRTELVERQVFGRIATAEVADAAIDRLVEAGLITTEPHLARTAAGDAVWGPLNEQVIAITRRIYDGLADEDLAVTQRTLEELARRGREALAEVA